ncbi:O-methyltransferase [Echria macrotheca]|uniref:O-methyltransferase n=1 Tax=Echria macrotheca TaxID=438768 RepID=A0AAJ0B695_9PEZI|nr:O-methyltransferase [Echria macrotheca]
MSGAQQRDLWTAVDEYAFSHSHPTSRPNTKALQHAAEASKEAGLPNIAASSSQAKFLAITIRALGVTHALEIGTLGASTAIWLASENPQLHVTSIEYDPGNAEVARKNVEFAGLSDRVEIIVGAGIDVIRELKQEVLDGKRPRFGFFFIDADKENNWNYFDVAADIATKRGLIVVDNVVRQGRVADASNTDARIIGSRQVIENAGKDARVDSVVLQTVGDKGHDGWLWAVVN